jgi:hypothetical protein
MHVFVSDRGWHPLLISVSQRHVYLQKNGCVSEIRKFFLPLDAQTKILYAFLISSCSTRLAHSIGLCVIIVIVTYIVSRMCQSPKTYAIFRNMLVIYCESLVAPTNTNFTGQPLVGCPQLLIQHIRTCPPPSAS